MNTAEISISFSRYSDANLETKAQHIVASLTGNAAYPTPTPKLSDLEAALTAYTNAKIAAEALGRVNVAEKNKARTALQLVLTAMGRYVIFTANGDITTLISSGYTLFKEPEPQHLPAVGNVTLSNGITAGELIASVKRPKGAKNYLHQISAVLPTDNTVWTSNPSSRSRYTFTNLQPGKQYWVRVAASGSNQQLAYSAVATQFAQ